MAFFRGVLSFLSSNISDETDEVAEDERYGWFLFTPDCLQRFVAPKWALSFCCPGPFIQGVLINGLLHFFIPSLERQFDLSSLQSGLISAGYDMAATVCLLPLAIYGGNRKAHRPKLIGLGLIVIGTGAIVFSTPAFLSGPYKQKSLKEVCPKSRKANLVGEVSTASKRQHFGWILFIANMLHGAGATPLYSIAVTFIDDCFHIHKASFYISIYYAMAVLGPLTGIGLGGALAQLGVNFVIYPSESSKDADADNPTWVGCWWLGFLASGLFCYIFSLPILGLPKEMPEMKQNRALRELLFTSHQLSINRIGELPRSVVRLVKNLKFLFLTLAACCEGIIFSGMAAFMTKLLLQQFGLGPRNQAIIKAIIGIPSSLIGMLGGGWVIKFFSMNLRQILTMIVCLMSFSFPCIGSLFFFCAHDDPVGFNGKGDIQLVTVCNEHCDCDPSYFNPVCGSNNKTYFSACFAGCTVKQKTRGIEGFGDCKCIGTKNNPGPDAIEGFCTSGCSALALFTILIFTYQTLTFFCVVPIITSTLRVVHSDIRSLGVAMQWVMGRLLGTIPGPLLFGKAIDDSCGYWQRNSDGTTGSCLHYNQDVLARNLALVIFASKLTQIIFFTMALRMAIGSHRRRSSDLNQATMSTIW